MNLQLLWNEALKPEHQYEIFKIVLEKGALALVLAFFGLVVTLLIEHYKAFLIRQAEINKITLPMVHTMIKASGTLHRKCTKSLAILHQEYANYSEWINSLLKEQVNVDVSSAGIGINRWTQPEVGETKLTHRGRQTNLRDFLVSSVENKDAQSFFSSDEFWKAPSSVGENSFCSNLLHFYEERNNINKALVIDRSRYVFQSYRSLGKQSYLNSIDNFRLLYIGNLFPENRNQNKALGNINQILDIAQHRAMAYPIDGVKEGLVYAALATQLRRFLRAS